MQNISKEVSRGAFALYLTLPLLIFGLINEPIYRSLEANLPLVFLLDALNKAIVPIAMCWYLLSKKILSRKELGIALQNPKQFIEDCFVCIPVLFVFWEISAKLLWLFLWPYDWILHSHLFSYHQMVPQGFILHCLTVFYLAITAAVSEELYFRGIFRFSTFALIRNKQIAKWVFILGSSLLFGLVHWKSGLANVVGAFFFGCVAARMYLWTNSLWPLMAGHFVVDMVSFM